MSFELAPIGVLTLSQPTFKISGKNSILVSYNPRFLSRKSNTLNSFTNFPLSFKTWNRYLILWLVALYDCMFSYQGYVMLNLYVVLYFCFYVYLIPFYVCWAASYLFICLWIAPMQCQLHLNIIKLSIILQNHSFLSVDLSV